MFVLGKDSEWMDRFPSIRTDGTRTMYAFVSKCQCIHSNPYHVHPSIHLPLEVIHKLTLLGIC